MIMIKAIGKVIVGDQTFNPGQIVDGLSESDITRMQTEGMINVLPDAPKDMPKKKDKSKQTNETSCEDAE